MAAGPTWPHVPEVARKAPVRMMTGWPASAPRRLALHAQQFSLYAAAAGLGALAAYGLLASPHLVKLLVLFPVLVFALTIPSERLFAGWLFVAPFVQGASGGQDRGHRLFVLFFFVPPLVLAARMALGATRQTRFWVVDALPALYLIYIIVRVRLLPTPLSGTEANLRAIYASVGIGIIGYYFLAFARTNGRLPTTFALALVWSGIIIAVLALIDAATGWNLWHHTIGGNGQVRRVSATLNGPVPLGTFLGTGVAFAVSTLLWKGPRSLKLPSIVLIGLSIPALYFTYTRGPILAIAAVAVGMALLTNRARWPSLLACAVVGLAVFAVWHQISSTSIYRDRLGVTQTVTTREAIQHESVVLFREKPVFGWGYNTFDQAKFTVTSRNPLFQNETSHDTYLTILDELGLVGFALLALPLVVVAVRAVGAARRKLAEPWIVAGSVGAAIAFALGALTYDARFFSFTTAIPWLTLGLARRVVPDAPAVLPDR
jgi:O-antigen ligase